ncbi:MAG: VOC family protein [Ignavibacteriaceae bacterium]|jgi:PhnB protein
MSIKPIPENYPRVSPYLIVKDCSKTIEFLKYVFGAVEREKMEMPDGTINHAEVTISDSVIMMGKATENHQPQNAMLYIYVEDTDAVYKRAIEKDAISVMKPADQFYGDRNAGVKDGDGVNWWMATHVEDVSQEEIQKRNAERAKK